MLSFESQARTFGAFAGIFHTGHPCPDEKRPASMQAALRVYKRPRKIVAAPGKTISNDTSNNSNNSNNSK